MSGTARRVVIEHHRALSSAQARTTQRSRRVTETLTFNSAATQGFAIHESHSEGGRLGSAFDLAVECTERQEHLSRAIAESRLDERPM